MSDDTRPGSPSPLVTSDVERAVDALRRGGLVAVPTETVYGLAADAANPAAVRRVFEVKGRPGNHPLIVHLAGAEQLLDWATDVPEAIGHLAETSWPGPLTVILPRADGVLDEVTGGRDTVGLRVPAHAMTLEVIRLLGSGIAAPSANRFGSVSPTSAAHVLADLGDRLDPSRDLILDGGPCPVGVESTIVDGTVDPPQLLRAGGIPPEEVEVLLDRRLASAAGPSRASGMLASHYAPSAAIRLVDHRDDAVALRAGTPGSEILDLGDDLAVAARDLYGRLRDADDRGVAVLIVVLPPPVGLGHALRDRLTKAAAPRGH